MKQYFLYGFSRKNIAMAGLVCILIISFTGCSNGTYQEISRVTNDGTINSDVSTAKSTDDSINVVDNKNEGVLLEKLLNSVKLPKQYLITYEVETKEGTLKYITKAKDAEGRIYYKVDSRE